MSTAISQRGLRARHSTSECDTGNKLTKFMASTLQPRVFQPRAEDGRNACWIERLYDMVVETGFACPELIAFLSPSRDSGE